VVGQAVATLAHLLGLLDAHINQRPPVAMVDAMALYAKALEPQHTIACHEAHGHWQRMLAALEGLVRHLDNQVGVFTPQVVGRMIVDVLRTALSHAAQASLLMLQVVAWVGNGQLDSGTLGPSASFALLSKFLVSPDIMAAVQTWGLLIRLRRSMLWRRQR